MTNWGLIVNTVFKTLICIECQISIDHTNPGLSQHFRSHHPHRKPRPHNLSEQLAKGLEEEYSALIYPPTPPESAVDPIYGLHPPLLNYEICQTCKKGYQGEPSQSFRKHPCEKERSKGVPSAVQRFTLSTSYFAVNTLVPPPPPLDAWNIYSDKMSNRPKAPIEMSVPQNYRILDQFLKKERWVEHVEGLDPSSLRSLIIIRPSDRLAPGLAKHCEAFLQHYQDALQSYSACRLIGTRPKYVMSLM